MNELIKRVLSFKSVKDPLMDTPDRCQVRGSWLKMLNPIFRKSYLSKMRLILNKTLDFNLKIVRFSLSF